MKIYDATHKDERRDRQRHASPESHARKVVYMAAYRLQHAKTLREYQRSYYETNKGLFFAHNAKRRSKMRELHINDLTHAQWVEIQEAQGHRCYYCHKKCKGRLTQDHIFPISKGGDHTLHNVIGACKSCNSKKNKNAPPIPVQPLLLTIASARKSRK